jgi:hypothetical protein
LNYIFHNSDVLLASPEKRYYFYLFKTLKFLMKIIKTLLPLIVITLSFTSCKKEKSSEGNENPSLSYKVKTYTENIDYGGGYTENVTFNLTYDASDRLVSMTSASSPGDRFEYKYAAGSFTMDLYNSDALSIHEIFFLNSKLLIDSTFQYNDSKDSSTEKYIYNSANQLITVKEYDYSKSTGAMLYNTTNYTYDSNGNAIKITDDYTITTYEYYTDLKNNLVFGTPYMQANKNLVKTTKSGTGSSAIILNHVYTFDTSNRISTETITFDSGEVATRTYTYYD